MSHFTTFATVSFEDNRPHVCHKGSHEFPAGARGCSIELQFPPEWDELPFRYAGFRAGNTEVLVENISNNVIVPAEIFRYPYVVVFMSVVADDANPDADTIARAAEIRERMAECVTVETLEERSRLMEELDSLNLLRKSLGTPWFKIGRVVPSCYLPEEESI